ncbi:MAG: T9SS type A sorting domain-containing protein, partial [Pseudomonadota bacterium]
MTLEEITAMMRERVGDSAGLNKAIKFDFGDDGVVRIDDTQSPAVYTQFIAPIEYTSADFPSYISIGFYSGFGCLSDTCSEGTKFWVDQVELLGEALNVQEEGISQRNISLFPNPAKDSFYIGTENELAVQTIVLYNCVGQEIKRWVNAQDSYSIANIDSGTYLLGIETPE